MSYRAPSRILLQITLSDDDDYDGCIGEENETEDDVCRVGLGGNHMRCDDPSPVLTKQSSTTVRLLINDREFRISN